MTFCNWLMSHTHASTHASTHARTHTHTHTHKHTHIVKLLLTPYNTNFTIQICLFQLSPNFFTTKTCNYSCLEQTVDSYLLCAICFKKSWNPVFQNDALRCFPFASLQPITTRGRHCKVSTSVAQTLATAMCSGYPSSGCLEPPQQVW